MIIAGGPEADETFDAHHIVIGEGEEALYTLITEGGGKVTYAKPVEDLDSIPSPYTPKGWKPRETSLFIMRRPEAAPLSVPIAWRGFRKG